MKKRILMLRAAVVICSAGLAEIASADEPVIAEFAGEGVSHSRPFDIQGAWEVHWHSASDLYIYAQRLSASNDAVGHSDEIASGKEGSSFVAKGGRYSLEILAPNKPWSVTVTSYAPMPSQSPPQRKN